MCVHERECVSPVRARACSRTPYDIRVPELNPSTDLDSYHAVLRGRNDDFWLSRLLIPAVSQRRGIPVLLAAELVDVTGALGRTNGINGDARMGSLFALQSQGKSLAMRCELYTTKPRMRPGSICMIRIARSTSACAARISVPSWTPWAKSRLACWCTTWNAWHCGSTRSMPPPLG